jgi:hypothetical protein
MEAHILLADSAAHDQQNGKIHALGLGWSKTTTPLPPQAIILLIKVPWTQANEQHQLEIELVDADGHPVTVPGQLGEQPVKIGGSFETGRPAGIPSGTPLDVALTFNIGQGMPLAPGRYTWVLTINGEKREDWSTSFLVAATPASASS